ncbi:esterase-like activity of phytase family protein [Roseobacter sp.]|uniref:esterase-like activity of phytase family protein n=1 Tax=Roseobacter sp. TaxID=1907202 RepID=UPI00385CF3E8
MRRSLAVVLVAIAIVAPVYAIYPPPASPAIAATDQTAQLVSTLRWNVDADWFGGFSGIEVTADGQTFFAVTDRGHIVRGTVRRDADQLTAMDVVDVQPLVDKNGEIQEFPHNDAEGLALDDLGRLNVSFEHAHRVLRYDTWGGQAKWPSYTRTWRALSGNKGLEMVAVDEDGDLYAIPEAAAPDATKAWVYRRLQGKKWDQPFTLPLTPDFLPVGGDIGPDGRLYLLERAFSAYGFRTQIRRMTVTDVGFDNIETLLQTPVRRHDNVEGLAVWADADGNMRMILVSDDNFLPFLRTEVIEYVVQE